MDTIYFDEVEIGHVEESESVLVDRDEMIAYAAGNDPWPIHIGPASVKGDPS